MRPYRVTAAFDNMEMSLMVRVDYSQMLNSVLRNNCNVRLLIASPILWFALYVSSLVQPVSQTAELLLKLE
jgi:hypothetical protein